MTVITVCSFKGGTAKTSICLNVGAMLAQHYGRRVLLLDFDAQANLTAGLGYDPDSQDSLAVVLQGKKSVEEIIVQTAHSGLSLIPADTWLERIEVTDALASDRYSHEKLKHLLEPLTRTYDTILIDTPPSLCWLTESALIASSHALIAATPEFYSIKGLQRLSEFLQGIGRRHPLSVLGVVLSFWNPRGKHNPSFLEVIEETFPGKVLQSKIRRDRIVSESAIRGAPVSTTAPKSRAAHDYYLLTQEFVEYASCRK